MDPLATNSCTWHVSLKRVSVWHRFQIRFLSRTRAVEHRLRLSGLGIGLASLVFLTAYIIASFSIGWVPVYLVVVVVILCAPRTKVPSVVKSKSAVKSADPVDKSILPDIEAAQLAEDTCSFLIAASLDGLRDIARPSDSGEGWLKSADSDFPKACRARNRVRKLARTGNKPAMLPISVTWICVGPGKFLRADTNTAVINLDQSTRSVESVRASCSREIEVGLPENDPIAVERTALNLDSMIARSIPMGPAVVLPATPAIEQDATDRMRAVRPHEATNAMFADAGKSQTGVHGIAPSATREILDIHPSVRQLNPGDTGVLGRVFTDLRCSTDAAAANGDQTAFRAPSRAGQASTVRPARIRSWAGLVMPNALPGPSRSAQRASPTTRTTASLSPIANVRVGQAKRHAFGTVSHVYRTACSRSPPCARRLEAGLTRAGHFWVIIRKQSNAGVSHRGNRISLPSVAWISATEAGRCAPYTAARHRINIASP